MSAPPPLGRYWSSRLPVGPIDFATMRRHQTSETRFIDHPFDDKWRVLLADHWLSKRPMPMLMLERTVEPQPETAEIIGRLCE